MTKLVSPDIDTELFAKVKLYPHQMNNNIYINLKNNLKKSIEKKCIKYGYIKKIYKINDYSSGIICPENLDSAGIFKIKYSCKLCRPNENTMIICRIDLINKVLVKAKNGPIICIIKISQINKENFSLNNNGDIVYNNDNKIIKSGDYIKVNIVAKNFFAGDERIVILAELVDLATDKEVNDFYGSEIESDDVSDTEENVNETEENESETEENNNNANNNYVNL